MVDTVIGVVDSRWRWRLAATESLCALVAEVLDVPVGLLMGAIGQSTYTVVELHAGPDDVDRTVDVLLRHVRTHLPGVSIEVRVPGRAGSEAVEAALQRFGLKLLRDEICYGRSLPADPPERAEQFTFRAYDAVGKAGMLAVLASVICDDPYFMRRGMDALDALDEMIEDCTVDGQLDPSLWYLVEVDGVGVGVVLGRYSPESNEGSLVYMGLAPAFRGKGLGGAVHRAALGLLTKAGAVDYRDATARDNLAMQRVFERNGCTPFESTRIWRLDNQPLPSKFESLKSLQAWLEADGHTVERFEQDWLRLGWRSGYHSRSLEIGWIADARVIQIVHVFAFVVPGQIVSEVARAIVAINASLNVPGFFLDESNNSAGFRLAILQGRDGCVDARELVTCCHLAVNTAFAYEDEITQRCRTPRRGISLERTDFAPRSPRRPTPARLREINRS